MFKWLKYKKDNTNIDRIFQPNYFQDEKIFTEYVTYGYCIIRNIVEEKYIDSMLNLYNEIAELPNFINNSHFLNSGRLDSKEIRNKVVAEIKEVSKLILPKFVNTDNASIETGGSFQIKPPSKDSILNPHQDTPIVNELEHYAVYVWIPLEDVNSKNGCLSLIPKSHLWGSHQRSLNIPWKYKNKVSKLWNKMIDIPINKGDLICFDSALIHGSKANLTDKTRVAFTSAILPKEYKLLHYFRGKDTPTNKVEVYDVDESFFCNENIMERPPAKYKLLRLEDWHK